MKDKNNTDDTSKKHLPLFGVGPMIVYGQFFITGMTLFLIFTEEKWLVDMYGEEYKEYCKKVNRCIPWFSRK